MNLRKMPRLKIGELEIKIPIVQGGMSVGISLSRLASAVAKMGCIGVIGAAGIGMLEPDFSTNFKRSNKRALIKEIRKAKELTNGIIGVNIMVALSDFDELLLVAIEEGADLVFLGAGLPLKVPMDILKKSSTKVVPIVSSVRAANIIFQYWAKKYNQVPDAVVVEGPLAGGHLGFKKEQINDPNYTLEKILPEVISVMKTFEQQFNKSNYTLEKILPEVISVMKTFEQQFNKSIPVIAAGGIYTGADIHKFIQLGAQGVQMATRFVATYECDADVKFKEAYVKCKKEDLIIIDSPVGLPGRAIRDIFLDDVSAGIKKPFKCPWKCLKGCDYRKAPYCIALALTDAKKGKLDDGFAFAGANAYRVDKIVSVKELIETLLTEFEKAASI
jgi:NAD(P)H-dependent flavin oxidoreductase YrpB (nitropropane dioxygenase family)